MYEDHTGNLWFRSLGKLSRYDGKQVTQFEFEKDLNVSSIIEDNAKKLWFGTSHGTLCYDPSIPGDPKFTLYTTNDGLLSNNSRGIATDRDGKLWIAGRDGLICYDGNTFTNYPSYLKVTPTLEPYMSIDKINYG